MSKSRQVTIAILGLGGVLFLAQGTGLIRGSFMSSKPIWAAVGSVMIGVALALFAAGRKT